MTNIFLILFIPFVACWVNFDIPDLYETSVKQLVEQYGYPYEEHQVITKDGYILTMNRIPHRKSTPYVENSQPIFLQHGLGGDSRTFLLKHNQSLPFILSDAGYDVWLGNSRGNRYSCTHKTLSTSPSATKYWNFSWHEMGLYDTTSELEYIANITNKRGEIIYIGYSMGTTIFFVYASLVKNASENVKMMIAMAPPVYLHDVKDEKTLWAAKRLQFFEMLNKHGFNKYYVSQIDKKWFRKMLYYLCSLEFNSETCDNVIVYLSMESSVKSHLHYLQQIYHENFTNYDYGPIENKCVYGQVMPPSYNLSRIHIPVNIISASSDTLVGPKDIKRLMRELPNATNYEIKNYTHRDYILAENAKEVCYDKILETIRAYN